MAELVCFLSTSFVSVKWPSVISTEVTWFPSEEWVVGHGAAGRLVAG